MKAERGNGKLLEAETYRFIHGPALGSEHPKLGLGWTARKEPFGQHLIHVAADGSAGTAVAMAPGNLDAILVTAHTRGKHAEDAISRALAAVRRSWIRARATQ